MKKSILPLVAVTSSLILFGTLCQTPITNTSLGVKPKVRDESQITDSELASALVGPGDLTTVANLGTVRPLVIELNAHLDPTPPDTYQFFVSRSWDTIPDGNLRIQNAIIKNASAADAQQFIQLRSANQTKLPGAAEVGDQRTLTYDSAADGSPAQVTIRFTKSTLVAKVLVVNNSPEGTTDADIQATLIPVANAIAEQQSNKIDQFLANTLPATENSPSLTSSALVNLSGTTLVGRIPVTEDEWLVLTGEFALDANIPGLGDAAMSRFIDVARPDEVVEVTILDFYVKDIAPEYQAQLVTDLNQESEIPLPENIADVGDAIGGDSLVESQLVEGNYVIDVSVFSPFGTLDKSGATEDLIQWTQELHNTFKAQ